jgi:hypothetical protein
MKKTLPSLISIILFINCLTVWGQFVPVPWQDVELKQSPVPVVMEKSDQEVIWYEDFGNGVPEGWLNQNLNGFCAFKHTMSGPQGPYSVGMKPLASQSAGNGFMILDSDLCSSQNPGNYTDAILQSSQINIPAQGSIMLTFQHNFRYCCSVETVLAVEISTDSLGWTSFDVRNGLGPNNTSQNPVYQAINISSFTAGSEKVWIRFRKTGASHYWWMIDDVRLVSFVDHDLAIVETAPSGGYTKIPAGQQVPFSFYADVKNAGGETQTQVVVTTSVNQYLYHAQDKKAQINPSQVVRFSMAETFAAPGRGIYHVEYKVSQKQQDMVPANNEYSFIFEVTDTIYSRTPSAPGNAVRNSSAGLEFGAGNLYKISEDIHLTSLSLMIHENTQPGTKIFAQVYSIKEGKKTLVLSSDEYSVTELDIAAAENLKPIVLTVDGLLEKGEYLAVIYAPAQTSLLAIHMFEEELQPENISFDLKNGNWTPMVATPFIDMNFGKNSGECDPRFHFAATGSLCGTSTGKISVIPLNGVGPYHYEWKDFADKNIAHLDSLAVGMYEVTITDARNCSFTHAIEVKAEDIKVTFTSTAALCNSGGIIELSPVNGKAPYSFQWAHDAQLNKPVADGLASGTYTIIVTDDNNCSVEVLAEVANTLTLPVEVIAVNAICASSTGSVEIVPLAGTAPYNYQWTNLDGNNSKQDKLAPGTYSFSVTDVNNCKISSSVTIVQEMYKLQVESVKTDPSCGNNDGWVILRVNNGTAPYQYDWLHGADGAEIKDLAPGTYSVAITDEYGCADAQTFELVNTGSKPEFTFEVNHTPECGKKLGSFIITPEGAAAGYSYQLMNDGSADGTVNSSGEYVVENLAAGHYKVKVMNADNCDVVAGINISDEGSPKVDATIVQVSCFGMTNGSIALTVEGASNPSFIWMEDETLNKSSLTGLKSGNYNVKITSGECVAAKGYTVTEPKQLLAEAQIKHIVCANEEKGSIQISVSGGTAPMAFVWSNNAQTKNLENVSAGSYTFRITDFYYCTFEKTYTIEGNPPLELNADVVQPTEGMSDGRIVLQIAGGVSPYDYLWNHGAKSSVVINLPEGEYAVKVTDDVGCQVNKSWLLGPTTVPEVLQNQVRIYPNPASAYLYIDIQSWMVNAPVYEVEVFNILGERVIRMNIPNGVSPVINTGNLHKGIYVIRITGSNQSWQSRFVKN